MRITSAGIRDVRGLWDELKEDVSSAEYLEDAAQVLTHKVYERFGESVVLARVFVTVPFGQLPEHNRSWVKNLATGAGVASHLKDETPCLSLIGSYGRKEPWCDRRKSEGHVGIPLVSEEFVGGIPMIARLLQELGVPMEWLERHDTDIVKKKIGDLAGVFHVDRAADAVDHHGRKIIAAQDFVQSEGIESVFGLGGAYFGGSILVLILFCGDELERANAERFLPLINFFKSKTTRLVAPGTILRE